MNPLDENRAQVQADIIKRRDDDASLPSFTTEPTLLGKIEAGGAALAGQVAGSLTSPEGWIGGPEAGAGEKIAITALKHAGTQAAGQGAANLAGQGLDNADGLQNGVDLGQAAQAAGTGAVLGAWHVLARPLLNAAGDAILRYFGLDGLKLGVNTDAENPTPIEPVQIAAPQAAIDTSDFDSLVPKDGAPAPPAPPAAIDTSDFDALVPKDGAPAASAPPAPPATVDTSGFDALVPKEGAPAPPAAPETEVAATSAQAEPVAPPAATGTPVEAPAAAAPNPTDAKFADPAEPAAGGASAPAPTIGSVTPPSAIPATTASPPAEQPMPRATAPAAIPAAAAPAPAPPSIIPTGPTNAPSVPPIAPQTGTVTTNAGRKIDVSYETVPAASLVPAPQALQPRDRAGRLASDAQVQNIAANLDPSRLISAPEADRGAPIVGPDHIIESGNGRVQAIQTAAANHPAAYARYVQAIQAAGHDVSGIDTPIRIARRITPLSDDDRRAFVQEANQSATQRMSAPEQARVDGQALTADMLAKYDPVSDPTSAANRPFLRDWVGTLPESERNAVMDAQGNLSAEGARRLGGAMLARAYDDKGVLARGLESSDDNARSISNGLADAAPAWAKLRAGVAAGDIPPEFDTSQHLVHAADIARTARDRRQSMQDVLGQQDAFNPMHPVTQHFVRALYDPKSARPASRASVGASLRDYAAEAAMQSTHPGLFGDAAKVTPLDVLKGVLARRDQQHAATPAESQGNLLGAGRRREPALADRPFDGFGYEARLPASVQAEGTTRPPLGGARPVRDFGSGTSPYRQVFIDAGRDPDASVSLPIVRQNQIIADQLQKAFGFKSVEIDKSQDPKEIRDQLSNFYQSGKEMANALGMPYRGIGLDGRVSLTTKPYRQPNQALGTYFPRGRIINIPGRSNSFAHEWTHALDHYLSDALANNWRARRLLSETKGVGQEPGTIGGKKIQPDTTGEAFVRVLRAMFGKDAGTAAEALRLQYDRLGSDEAKAALATLRLDEIETQFAGSARAMDAGRKAYWSKPAEMLARAHEAYVSEMIQRQGGETAAVAKPYYAAQTPAEEGSFGRAYPQQDERDAIFQAFTDLHDVMRRDDVLGAQSQGVGERAGNLGMVDPSTWDKMADTAREPGLTAALKREVQAQKNFRAQLWHRAGFDDTAADPGRLSVGTRAVDNMLAITGSIRGIANRITARQPAGPARAAFQRLTDLIVPAEHIRSPAAAAGRYMGPVFEEDVREHSRQNINRLGNLLEAHGLAAKGQITMSHQDGMMLRHILTTGDEHGYRPDQAGPSVRVPANIVKAAGAIRYLLDQEWERDKAAGINIGYARSGYYPRLYDDHKIYGKEAGFRADAEKLHALMFDRDVGDDPAKLLAAHDRLPADVRDQLPADVARGVGELRAVLKAQDKLQANDAADPAKVAKLAADAADLHAELKAPLREVYSQAAAQAWFDAINVGDPNDFDTRGPSASYTRARVLPPEADTIMRDWMVTDPSVALPMYFQQSARKVAFAKRFGVGGGEIDKLVLAASRGGARGEDIRQMRHLVEVATGKQKSGLPSGAEKMSNVIHAVGSMPLMTRAAWSSLSEPAAMYARTANARASMQAFANQFGDIARTAGSKQRAELANALGITTSHLYDSIIADRTEAKYRDSPGLSRFMANYYKRTGLTQLTNSQRRSVMAAGHIALDAWSKDLLADRGGSNGAPMLDDATGAQIKVRRLARDAAAQFRDLGVPDAKHQAFAEWVTAHPGLPSLADLNTPGGRLWGSAISRLTDKVIQDPLKVDKPLMSQNPVGRLAYGLMSYNFAFFHNVVEHNLHLHSDRAREAGQDAKAAGAGRFEQGAAKAAQLARSGAQMAAGAAAIFAASYLTTVVRERLLNGDAWDQHDADGDTADWLIGLAFQRSGFNGPLDPVIQAATGLKYERDLSSLTAGAQVGYFLQAAGDLLKPFVGGGSESTNTADYNAIKGAWNLFGVPAASAALTALPGGPLAGAAYSAAMQYTTSRGFADKVATELAGPKGTGLNGEPPGGTTQRDPYVTADQPKPSGSSGTIMGVPLSIADDFAAPAIKVALPVIQRLPVVGKVALVAALAGGSISAVERELDRYSAGGDPDARREQLRQQLEAEDRAIAP